MRVNRRVFMGMSAAAAAMPMLGAKAETSKIEAIEKFDQPPSRYTEASLVKKMEELGIGRPSTYAPTISTIQQREYVVKENKPAKKRTVKTITLSKGKIKESTANENYGAESNKLFPTSIGIVVTDYLTAHFDDVLDYNFTAQIEEKFDEIAMGKLKWNDMLKSFYKAFDKEVDSSLKEKETSKWERNIGNDPKTGAPVIGLIDSTGLRLMEATDALSAFGAIYRTQAKASGLIPQRYPGKSRAWGNASSIS